MLNKVVNVNKLKFYLDFLQKAFTNCTVYI